MSTPQHLMTTTTEDFDGVIEAAPGAPAIPRRAPVRSNWISRYDHIWAPCLILTCRWMFLALSVIPIAYLAHSLRLATESRFAVGFALLFCIATNWALVYVLPIARPDSPMLAFSALALAVYVRILFLGMTIR